MKFLVISDLHGNKEAFDYIINYINKNNISIVLNLGDIIGGDGSKEVVKKILFDNRFINVSGNHDVGHLDWVEEELGEEFVKKLKSLPLKRIINIGGKRFLMVHSREESNTKRPLIFEGSTIEEFLEDYKSECDYVLFGHTHYQHYSDYIVGKPVINPGSLGLSYDSRISFLEVSIDGEDIDFCFKKRKM